MTFDGRRPADWSTAEMLERSAIIFDSQAALATGSARAAHKETAAALRARALKETPEPPATVYLVGNGTYLSDELEGVYASKAIAEATAAQKGGMWEATSWDVETKPGEPEEDD